MSKTAVSFTGGKDSVLALHLTALSLSFRSQCHATVACKQGCGDNSLLLPGLSKPTADAAAAARKAIALLVTFAPAGYNSNSFKAHPLPIIQAQARALQIPHVICTIDQLNASNSYKQQLAQLHSRYGITQLVTGDILDVADGFMLRATEGTGVQLVTPLWQLPRNVVLTAMFDLGIKCVISCVNTNKYRLQQKSSQPEDEPTRAANGIDSGHQQQACMGQADDSKDQVSQEPAEQLPSCEFDAVAELLGQQMTPQLLAGPLQVAETLYGADLCGEHGEYHTIVLDAPLFVQAVELQVQRVATAGAYAYLEWDADTPPRSSVLEST